MPDDRTLGQVLHEARIKHNPPLERPRNVPPREERAPWQRELDEQMAADVEAVVRQRIVDEIRKHASAWPPGFQRNPVHSAADAVAREGQERSDEQEPCP